MKWIESVDEIIGKYQTFVIDLSGVMHDGKRVYISAKNAFTKLVELNKEVIFLSNSPRSSQAILAKFPELHCAIVDTPIVTSGDFFLTELKSGNVMDVSKQKVCVMGAHVNRDLVGAMQDLGVQLVENIADAQFFMMLAPARSQDELFAQNKILDKALNYKLTMLCVNPDAVALNGADRIFPSGSFAEQYQNFGGIVSFYGKPHQPIYDFCLQNCTTSRDEILAIGDNIFTDIRGARQYRIDSLLIQHGVHRNVADIRHLCRNWDIIPNYVAAYFSI